MLPLRNETFFLKRSQRRGSPKSNYWPDVAPNHVARITELVESGFYDGIVFHRVIPRFHGTNW